LQLSETVCSLNHSNNSLIKSLIVSFNIMSLVPCLAELEMSLYSALFVIKKVVKTQIKFQFCELKPNQPAAYNELFVFHSPIYAYVDSKEYWMCKVIKHVIYLLAQFTICILKTHEKLKDINSQQHKYHDPNSTNPVSNWKRSHTTPVTKPFRKT